MVSVNHRGWTSIDDSIEVPDHIAVRATALMNEWSTIHHQQERISWADRDAYDEYDYDPRNCDCDDGRDADPDELCVHDRAALEASDHAEQLKRASVVLKLELIEAELEHYGLRKMRPYEHHNEDERYYQYMEEGRFGHYSD